jgi:Putative peptidoglycan binding domain
MKSILVLTCCLALASVASADQNKHKNKQANQVQGQQVQQQAVIKPGKHAARTGLQTNSQLRMGGGGGKNSHLSTTGSTGSQSSNTTIIKNKNVTNVNVKQFNVTKNFNTKYQAIKFQPGVRFKNSSNWKGNNYIVFRTYSPVWHDQFWWTGHHSRIVLIGGGWYYWDANYWYPAWGYDPGARFVYDGPIYAYHDMDPGQVVANVQSALQQQGYYEGDVDGLMGPLTRAALARYQADHGLYETAAIDQPTLEALGFA